MRIILRTLLFLTQKATQRNMKPKFIAWRQFPGYRTGRPCGLTDQKKEKSEVWITNWLGFAWQERKKLARVPEICGGVPSSIWWNINLPISNRKLPDVGKRTTGKNNLNNSRRSIGWRITFFPSQVRIERSSSTWGIN